MTPQRQRLADRVRALELRVHEGRPETRPTIFIVPVGMSGTVDLESIIALSHGNKAARAPTLEEMAELKAQYGGFVIDGQQMLVNQANAPDRQS